MNFVSNNNLVAVTSSSEVAVIQDCNASSLPTGTLYCNGETKNTADYPELAAALGESGATFDLPFLVNEKTYDENDITVTLDPSDGTMSSYRIDAVPRVVDGEWWLTFQFIGVVSSAARTLIAFNMDGVVFDDYQECCASAGATDLIARAYVNPSGDGDTFAIEHSSITATSYKVFGDVKLASKPSWVLDNSPANYDVYKVIRYAPKTALNATATSTGSISATGDVNENAGIDTYFCTNAADTGDITITLPSAAGLTGREFTFIKTDSTTNNIIIDGDGSETLNGYSSITLDCQYARIKIVSDGSNWQVLDYEFTDKKYTDADDGVAVNWSGSTDYVYATPTRGLDGVWYLDLVSKGSLSAGATNISITVDGIDPDEDQPIVAWVSNNPQEQQRSWISGTNGTIRIYVATNASSLFFNASNIRLESKPTFVA